MRSPRHSVRSDAATFAALGDAYLAQLSAPLDDMWAAFAEMAAPHALLVEDEVIGCCAVDAEARLLRFFVEPVVQHHSLGLLRTVLGELKVARMMVPTSDPNYLSTALDLASRVLPHTLLFAPLAEPEGVPLEDLRLATDRDHGRIVDFQEAELGAPRQFLEPYARERIERGEMLLFEVDSRLECVGELRRDARQAGVAQVGLVVRGQTRGSGVGTRMLCSLVERSRAEGLTPYCSTEVANVAARKAIERAGFRASHRLLNIEFEL